MPIISKEAENNLFWSSIQTKCPKGTDHFVLFSIYQQNNRMLLLPNSLFSLFWDTKKFRCYCSQQGLAILAWYQSLGGLNLEEISKQIKETKLLG